MKAYLKFILVITVNFASGVWAEETCAQQLANPEAVADRLRKLSLQEVYAYPLEELERLLLAGEGIHCPNDDMKEEPGSPKKLSGIEECALYTYTVSRFGMNKQLWETKTGEGLDGEEWAYIRVLDVALSKIPSPKKPVRVYRGTSQNKPELQKPGQLIRFKGYTSTSSDYTIAEGFLNGEADRMMVIDSISAKNLQGYAGVYEKEYLIPRSTYLRYDRSQWKTIEVFNEDKGETEKRRVEFVYLTEVPAKK